MKFQMPEDPGTYYAIKIIEWAQLGMSWDVPELGMMTRALEHLAETGSMQETEWEGELN